MGTPADHLPGAISEDQINVLLASLGLPKALSATSPSATAQYHTIYRIILPSNDAVQHADLILRVSGSHLPTIKTENEVGVMTWVSRETSIPVPTIVAYDATAANPLGHEYTLLSRVRGDTLSDIYPTLSQEQIEQILIQLIDFLSQLHQHEWNQIGGLQRTKRGEIVVGQILDEAFWQTADVAKFWPPSETVSSLNIRGPCSSYVELIIEQVQKYIELINIHESLAFLRDMIPRLQAFIDVLPTHSSELNRVKLRLAHKDLHFGNMLYDVDTGVITAILDWEFAGVVPMTKWNPSRAFLWNGRNDEASGPEKQRLMEIFARLCEDRGVSVLADAAYATPLQDSMQAVADYLRAVTEVVPRGQRKNLVPSWVAEVEKSLACFGV